MTSSSISRIDRSRVTCERLLTPEQFPEVLFLARFWACPTCCQFLCILVSVTAMKTLETSTSTQTKGCHLHACFSLWNRSPMPKLGDLRPNVVGRWWLNSTLVAPEIDLNRDPLEKEYFCFDGEKLTLSWVSDRHLCLLLWWVVILFTIRAINFIFIT